VTSDELRQALGHLLRLLCLQEMTGAVNVQVLGLREPGMDELASLDEEGSAVGTEDGQNGLANSRRLIRTKGPLA
jgi:hypothetical protein